MTSQRMIKHQVIPRTACSRGNNHRHAVEGIGVETVKKDFEKASVTGGKRRGDSDNAIGGRDLRW